VLGVGARAEGSATTGGAGARGRDLGGYLAADASCPVNVDSHSHELTKRNMTHPDRWSFDTAAAHVYHLMKSDSYSRYLRSEMYKDFLNGSKKKVNNFTPYTSILFWNSFLSIIENFSDYIILKIQFNTSSSFKFPRIFAYYELE
ncbi:regulator of G-protein signaling 7-like, partial [Nilaparvata lugens]|uniref:regulator of G-protein signaling 7-like n=1 Tax=Nilaparvata lugens TaxID=108931 RepID=UPI00193D09CF